VTKISQKIEKLSKNAKIDFLIQQAGKKFQKYFSRKVVRSFGLHYMERAHYNRKHD
jgi:hypothetical protein